MAEGEAIAASDDEVLVRLIAPAPGEAGGAEANRPLPRGSPEDDAAARREALAQESSFAGEHDVELLTKIARLRTAGDRVEARRVFEPLAGDREIAAPPPGGGGGPAAPSLVALRVRRIGCIQPRVEDTEPGSLCFFAATGDAGSACILCEQARRLDDRFFVSGTDGRGRSPLHHAAFEGSEELTELLLHAAADVEQRDADGRTPLHVAVSRGHAALVRLMIGTCVCRLRASAQQHFRDLRAREGFGIGEATSPLVEAAAAFEVLREYLGALEELRLRLFLAEDRFDCTPVHYALRDAYQGCLPALKFLLSTLMELGDHAVEASEAGGIAPVMRDRRFQVPSGTSLVDALGAHLAPHELAQLRRLHRNRSRSIREEIACRRDVHSLAPLHYAAADGNYRAVYALLQVGGNELTSQLAGAYELAKDSVTRQALSTFPAARRSRDAGQAGLPPPEVAGMASLTSGSFPHNCKRWPPHRCKPTLRMPEACCLNHHSRGILARTTLHAAVFRAIEAGVPDAGDFEADPPMVFAMLDAHPACDPLAADANGWTALHYACAYGCEAELSHLVHRVRQLHPKLTATTGIAAVGGVGTGASKTSIAPRRRPSGDAAAACCDRQLPFAMPRLMSLDGRTPAHLAAQGAGSTAEEAVLGTNTHLSCLEQLQQAGLLDLEAEDNRGWTPLLAACASGSSVSARWLLEQRADCRRRDRLKRNALHLACTRGDSETIRLLCYYDSDTSQLKAGEDWKGRKPDEMLRDALRSKKRGVTVGRDAFLDDFATIWEAARIGDLDELLWCLRRGSGGTAVAIPGSAVGGVDVDALSPSGWTAAMYAAASGHVSLLRQLLARDCVCDPPLPPVLGAGAGGPEPNVRARPWVSRPDARPAFGRGPLHLAAEYGHAEACALLLRMGAASLETRSSRGLTPLLHACRGGHLVTIQELLSLGADVEADTQVATDVGAMLGAGFSGANTAMNGRNAFHILAAGNSEAHAACVRWLVAYLDASSAVHLLEASDEGYGLPTPVKVAAEGSRTQQAIARAAAEALARLHQGGAEAVGRQHEVSCSTCDAALKGASPASGGIAVCPFCGAAGAGAAGPSACLACDAALGEAVSDGCIYCSRY